MKKEDAEEYTESLGQILGGGWRQIALAHKLGVPKALGLTTQEWTQDRLGGYTKLSITERREAVVELIEDEGMSQRQAALVLGVDQKTISNDLKKPTEENSSNSNDANGVEEHIEENSSPEADPVDDPEHIAFVNRKAHWKCLSGIFLLAYAMEDTKNVKTHLNNYPQEFMDSTGRTIDEFYEALKTIQDAKI